MDIAITIFKYLSLLIGTFSGILGLVSDFRDKTSNKITKNGNRLLWLIITSSFISLLLQTLELYNDKMKDQIAEKRTFEEAVKTNRMLKDLNRTLNPIKDISVNYTIQIPLDHPYLNSYRQRLTKQLDSIITSVKSLNIKQKENILFNNYGIFVTHSIKDSIISIEFDQKSSLLPQKMSETLAFYTLKYAQVDYSFYYKSDKNISTPIKPDFYFSIISSNNDPNDRHRINYQLNNQSLYIIGAFLKSDPKFWKKTGKIISIPDLEEAELTMELLGTMVSGDDNIDNKLLEIRRYFKLKNSYLNLSEGRELQFRENSIKPINKDGELPKYLFIFPKNINEISSY